MPKKEAEAEQKGLPAVRDNKGSNIFFYCEIWNLKTQSFYGGTVLQCDEKEGVACCVAEMWFPIEWKES